MRGRGEVRALPFTLTSVESPVTGPRALKGPSVWPNPQVRVPSPRLEPNLGLLSGSMRPHCPQCVRVLQVLTATTVSLSLNQTAHRPPSHRDVTVNYKRPGPWVTQVATDCGGSVGVRVPAARESPGDKAPR